MTAERSPDSERVIRVLMGVVDETNRQLPRRRRLASSPETVLSGPGGRLDSLGLINFIVAAEQRLEEEFGVRVSLTDDVTAAHSQEVFQTVGTLAEHVSRALGNAS